MVSGSVGLQGPLCPLHVLKVIPNCDVSFGPGNRLALDDSPKPFLLVSDRDPNSLCDRLWVCLELFVYPIHSVLASHSSCLVGQVLGVVILLRFGHGSFVQSL